MAKAQKIDATGVVLIIRGVTVPDYPDHYLKTYPVLLTGIREILKDQTENNFWKAGALVYSWMPQCDIGFADIADIKPIWDIINKAQTTSQLTVAEITAVAQALCPRDKKKSLVAASKLLHFIAPDKYPMFDSNVVKIWRGSTTNESCFQNYLKFVAACHWWVGDGNIQDACEDFRLRLHEKGHPAVGLTNIRLIELALFLAGKNQKKAQPQNSTPAIAPAKKQSSPIKKKKNNQNKTNSPKRNLKPKK